MLNSANKYTGDTPFAINGETLTLCFDWRALTQVTTKLGEKGRDKALSGELEELASIIEIGLAKHHPEWTASMVAEASPAVIPARVAVQNALQASYYGPKGSLDSDDEEQTENPKMPLGMLLKKLLRRR